MFKIASPTAVSGAFVGGNPGTAQQATALSPEWCNDLQQELVNVQESDGQSETGNDQLKTAILNSLAPSVFWEQIHGLEFREQNASNEGWTRSEAGLYYATGGTDNAVCIVRVPPRYRAGRFRITYTTPNSGTLDLEISSPGSALSHTYVFDVASPSAARSYTATISTSISAEDEPKLLVFKLVPTISTGAVIQKLEVEMIRIKGLGRE